MRLDQKYNAALSKGDLIESSFSGAESASGANVTGLIFTSADVRGFEAQVSVHIDATADLTASYKLYGIQKTGGWELSVGDSIGDSGTNSISFDINTSTGQVTYSSSTYTGFSSMGIKFRASSTSI